MQEREKRWAECLESTLKFLDASRKPCKFKSVNLFIYICTTFKAYVILIMHRSVEIKFQELKTHAGQTHFTVNGVFPSAFLLDGVLKQIHGGCKIGSLGDDYLR